ncbi:MAG: UvrD-helicase domain-containing protein [Akkermansia sp.]
MLDEFQDTSQSQWRVIAFLDDLAESGRNEGSIFVVGVSQSVYQWRGETRSCSAPFLHSFNWNNAACPLPTAPSSLCWIWSTIFATMPDSACANPPPWNNGEYPEHRCAPIWKAPRRLPTGRHPDGGNFRQ